MQGRARANAAKTQRGKVKTLIGPGQDMLGNGPAGGGRMHDPMAGKTICEHQVGDFVMRADNRIVVKGIDLVMTGP